MTKPQVLVCQRGARRRYAVPRMLENLGILSALYTDSCVVSQLGKLACITKRLGVSTATLRALDSRNPLLPVDKVYATDLLFWKNLILPNADLLAQADSLSKTYEHWGIRDANIIYSMNTAEIPFLEYAKKRGVKVVMDVFVSPLTDAIVSDEEKLVFGEVRTIKDEQIRRMRERYIKSFGIADILLCPSEWVAAGCRSVLPECAPKIRLCSYGSSIELAENTGRVEKKRVLFAGRDPLRKGLRYLAAAAAELHEDHPEVEFLVAGVHERDCPWIKEKNHLTFMGHVPMKEMRALFSSSYLFVLPSLTEGQAGVAIESLAMGCPVVITKECGVDIKHGKQGLIVPARDASALADAMRKLLENDDLRSQMAEESLAFSKYFSTEAWSDRLVSVFDEILSTP